MNALQYSILSITTDGLFIDEKVQVKDIQPAHVDPIPLASFEIRGDFSRMDEDFLFHGQMSGVFAHPCDRCLEKAYSEVDVEVYWLFEEGPEMNPYTSNEEEIDDEAIMQDVNKPDYRTYQHGVINLAPYVWEELCFALPMKFLCAATCKGLCPVCGNNLNHQPCHCAEQQEGADANQAPNPFSKLAEMFPDLPKGNNSGNKLL